LVATGPNQVWCWDITWIKTDVRGLFYYAYVVMDLYSRKIVGWTIEEYESATLARNLFRKIISNMKTAPAFVHSDNGNPMKGITFTAFLSSMHIAISYSRPRVSNDNPFIESFFRTVKYKVNYPGQFGKIENARIWFADFVDWYNTKHRHSGINYVTPEQRHLGQDKALLQIRQNTLNSAVKRTPNRFVNGPRKIICEEVCVLNPEKSSTGTN
jgi:transposase InsO family protein